MIYRIDETTSTNDEARDAKYRHGDIVWAERPNAGPRPRAGERCDLRRAADRRTRPAGTYVDQPRR